MSWPLFPIKGKKNLAVAILGGHGNAHGKDGWARGRHIGDCKDGTGGTSARVGSEQPPAGAAEEHQPYHAVTNPDD